MSNFYHVAAETIISYYRLRWRVFSDRITIWSQIICCFILIVMFTERCPVGILCDDPPRCVPNEARCNAIADCADGTDELSCPGRSSDTQEIPPGYLRV